MAGPIRILVRAYPRPLRAGPGAVRDREEDRPGAGDTSLRDGDTPTPDAIVSVTCAQRHRRTRAPLVSAVVRGGRQVETDVRIVSDARGRIADVGADVDCLRRRPYVDARRRERCLRDGRQLRVRVVVDDRERVWVTGLAVATDPVAHVDVHRERTRR